MEDYKVTLCDVEFTVSFLITGEDRPSTWTHPAEHREIDIQKIMIGDVDAYDLALNYKILESIEEDIAEEFLR